MLKKYLWAILILFLAACGSGASTEEKPKEPKQTEQAQDNEQQEQNDAEKEESVEEEPPEDLEETGEWEDKDFGKVRVVGVGYNDEVGIDGKEDTPGKPIEMGPIKLFIDGLMVLEVEPNEDMKELVFEDQDKVRAIVTNMRAENTSEDDVEFYPNQSIMVTDTGEQVESDMLLMGDIGGEFLGKVKMEDQTWWILKDPDKDIKTVKMIINPPSDANSFDDLSEEKRLEFEVLSFEEAKKKDGN